MERIIYPERRRIYRRLVAVAAMLILFLGGGGIVFWKMTREKEPVQWVENQEIDGILPGEKKATLILAGGHQVELGKTTGQKLEIEGLEIKEDQIIVKEKPESPSQATEWNKLLIPRGGEYKLRLGDGTEVFVNSESSLRFPVEFSANERVVCLQGEAYFKVAREESRPFKVRTDGMDIQVLGTEFNVKAYETERHVQATLVKGRVRVATGKEKRQYLDLQPLQQADLDLLSEQLVVKEVDVNSVIAWKNGQFIFKGERLEEIMTVLARWYDFEVFYQNDKIRDLVFAGKLNRLESIHPILEIIESTDKIHVEIQGKTLILSEK